MLGCSEWLLGSCLLAQIKKKKKHPQDSQYDILVCGYESEFLGTNGVGRFRC